MNQNIPFRQDITPPVQPPPPPAGMTPPPPPPPQFGGTQDSGGSSTLAIVSLVVGIISYFMCPLIGGVAAWIMGKMELGKIERGESSSGGATLAKIGMWLGIINVALSILVGLLYILIVIVAILSSSR